MWCVVLVTAAHTHAENHQTAQTTKSVPSRRWSGVDVLLLRADVLPLVPPLLPPSLPPPSTPSDRPSILSFLTLVDSTLTHPATIYSPPTSEEEEEREWLLEVSKRRKREREEEERRRKEEEEEQRRQQEEEWRKQVEIWQKQEEEEERRRKEEQEEDSSGSSQSARFEWSEGRLLITFLSPPLSLPLQNAASRYVSPPRLAAQRVSLIPVSPQSMSQRHVSTKTILTQPTSATESYKGRIPLPISSSPFKPQLLTRASPRAMTPRRVPTEAGRQPVTDRASVADESLKHDKDTRPHVSRNSRSTRNHLNYQKISNAPLRKNVSQNTVISECYIAPVNNASKRQGSPCKANPGSPPGPTLLSPGLVSRAMRTPRHSRTPRRPHMCPIKEASSSSSANELDSEEEHLAAPTPPLFNGHAIIRHPDNGCNGKQVKDENLNDTEPLISHETNKKEGFHSLLHAYTENTRSVKESPEPAPLSDGEDLVGVSVKQLRSSYLSVAQDTKRATPEILKTPVKSEIKAELNTSVNISTLVDTYSTPQPRPVTPSSRPDDITPVSLRSLKSAYEATASGSSCAVSRHSSSGSCSPAGGSPAPKEELNVSLQQLREEYCRSVQDGLSRSQTPSKQPLDTGVSIRQLVSVPCMLFPTYKFYTTTAPSLSQEMKCRV
ncbi:hypothetical protein E2C01_006051 [Portunus trituberculatus]|uniref:Uncharacterized protein n=1 Tax=Portunus trituberculatus TaxID=210409 RepID=A0A5B7CVU9_PORTR|nr:hypothetical protein [Portunus trituberculatus]